MANSKKDILVYTDWEGMDGPVKMGTLSVEFTRGREIFSFSYERSWLDSDYAQVLDPHLLLYEGPQFLKEDQPNFGIFLDSSPDRWGRMLMRRREAALARIEQRPEKHLSEIDYLLGVYDGHRMGGLRFKDRPEGPFLNNNRDMATPPWATLRDLEYISLKLEDEEVIDDPEYLKWLNMLIDPGASLGGARPKAGILDKDNRLWIAKFPSRNDRGDIGGWEMVTYELAKRAGIDMAPSQALKFTSQYHTFLTQRFDRSAQGDRIHFSSAMTLLEYNDGNDFQDGASYLELADFITTHGASVESDLAELWRRIVFSICVSNTDDHLRNHGFLLTKSGWRLSPAYDINPIETGTGLKLNISENDNALDLDLALSVIDYFRLEKAQAMDYMQKIIQAVKSWPEVASKFGISRTEQALKSIAFSRAK